MFSSSYASSSEVAVPADYFPEDQAHILNAGAPVWSMDWCPIHPEDRPGKRQAVYIGSFRESEHLFIARSFKKYLAIAPFPSQSYSPEIGRKVARPSYACIQIWSLAPSQIRKNSGKKNTDLKSASGRMECEMVLCIDTGPAYDLKWCPLPSHDLVSEPMLFFEHILWWVFCRILMIRIPGNLVYLVVYLKMALSPFSLCRIQTASKRTITIVLFPYMVNTLFLQLGYLNSKCTC